MLSENEDKINDELEKLKKERDTLLLKHEIKKLKKAESREQDIKNLSKKIIINSAKTLVYLLAALGVFLFLIGSTFARGREPGLIIGGLALTLPLIVMLVTISHNKQKISEEKK